MLRSFLLYLLSLINRLGYQFVKLHNGAFEDQKLILEAPKVVFDVGSNKGQSIQAYMEIFPTEDILFFSFEPIKGLMEIQKKKFEGKTNIAFVEKALSDYVGESTFNINKSQDTSSLLDTNIDFIPERYGDVYKKGAEVTVATTTIDAYLEEQHLERIDILKIDVQGAEVQVLKGAINTLTAQKIKLIYIECLFVPLYKDQAFFDDIVAFLYNLGYRAYSGYNFSFNFRTGRIMHNDMIFVCQSLSDNRLKIKI